MLDCRSTRDRAMRKLRSHRRVSPGEAFQPRPAGLGPLETRVLEELWGHDRALTVRHVHVAFPELAYTTLMTTLDRLYRKGVLVRRRRGRAFVYEPRCSRGQMLNEHASSQFADLLAASDARSA